MTPSDDIEPELEYDDDMIAVLEAVWGAGFLSPGGTDEVDRILDGMDLTGLSAIDIGCGLGGATLHIAGNYGVSGIIGIDIEDNLIEACETLSARMNLQEKASFRLVEPGPLPFDDDSLDMVFSKDSIIHIADKHTLAKDIFRCLKPGGWLSASDWLAGYSGDPSPQMKAYVSAEGLDFGLASAEVYKAALEEAGFVDVRITDRNAWYREEARRELENLAGALHEELESTVGKQFLDRQVDVWRKMIVVLDQGELRPTHLRARKP
ncbi:MAG: methyltransferase domain-containing protein [Thalassospira sp.]|uniref:methyltransferase domain-containing protein n=1 Tax=Thalassospira sp. TaxID=1912094 RepID=UPI003A85996E